MQLKFIGATLIVLFAGMRVPAQQTFFHTRSDQVFRSALELYENGKYSAAQLFFDEYADLNGYQNSKMVSEAQYYAAMCAVRLFNHDAEYRMLRFISLNPEHARRNHAVYSLAGYFYQRKNYNAALQYYEKTDPAKLSPEEQAEYHFKSGYCWFLKDDFSKARSAFSQVKDLPGKYSAPSQYYYSHIHYTQGNYETALAGFLKIKEDANFGPIVPYYLTQIYYKQKRYEEVVKYGPELMENVTEKRAPEVSRLVGESYFQLGLFAEAIPYLERYTDSGTGITSADRYSLAYAYFRVSRFEDAARIFSQVAGNNTSTGQYAWYHLAACQLQLNEKNKARMAFSAASKLDFDEAIQEESLYNYALLTYELDYSPFNEAVQALNDYLDRYPDSPRAEEAANYLVTAYLNAKNYRLALASVDKIRNKSTAMKKAYQRIAYFRGLELFSNLQLDEAIEILASSAQYGRHDEQLYALSLYWQGEAYYRKENYRKALEFYQSFFSQSGVSALKEYALAHYNAGYCYFELRQYSDAAVWFNRFTGRTAQASPEMLTDAFNRLGDCYFVQMEYSTAIAFYDKAINTGRGNTDYALLQKGLAQGVSGRDAEKIVTLNRLLSAFPGSAYKADVYFQLGESYMKLNQPDKAINSYNQVIAEFPQSSYVKKSLLSLALLHFNANRNPEAVRYYKQVLTDFPGTDEAANALIGLRNVYVDMNQVDAYYAFIREKGIITASDAIEEDSLSFMTAERIYMAGDYTRAATQLGAYIGKHPSGRYLLPAHFYKGDCHYRAQEFSEALASFDYIVSRPRSKYSEPALLGSSRIRFREKNLPEAIRLYRMLEENAELQANLMEARLGLLRCYALMESNEQVIEMADRVLLSGRLSPEQERETRFFKAKALLAKDRQMLALEEFRKVAGEVKSAEGAEAKFRMAEIYYARNEKDNAEKEISDFADKTTPHQYWMAKSFLLWADIFLDKGDDFQAIQTLQSLIDYYGDSDDGILAEARAKKQKLESGTQKAGETGVSPELEIQIREQ